MIRALLVLAALITCLAPTAWARYGNEDPRLQKLFQTFLSPCCWREDLTIHDSPTADQVRAQIRVMIAEGKTDDQIKNTLVNEHTKRILTMPEGASSTWLFSTPWLFGLLGLSVLILTVRRIVGSKPNHSAPSHPLPDLDPALLDD
jgi:cytochrome c-type biogenesis protein CcmH